MKPTTTRRAFLAGAAALIAGAAPAPRPRRALIAITLDLEMSRNFPTWEQTHWDYEKGNLDDATKKYAVEAARRVKERGGVVHFFLVGRALEQENVDWLKEIVRNGHPVGNHTYDHVNVLADRPEDIQFRFRRAPWLIEGRPPRQVIEENIRLTSAALKTRIGISPAGFRTPGGFSGGLKGRPDRQRMLLDLGFSWISSLYPPHRGARDEGRGARNAGAPGSAQQASRPNVEGDVFRSIVRAQEEAQPFAYPTGLVEVPMNPISDITAFRAGRWSLDDFLGSTRMSVEWAIERGAVFDFLGHPSCLYVTDPKFRTIDLICDLVRKAGDRAALVDLGTIAAERGTLTK